MITLYHPHGDTCCYANGKIDLTQLADGLPTFCYTNQVHLLQTIYNVNMF